MDRETTPSDHKLVADETLDLPTEAYVRLKVLAAQRKTDSQSLMLEAVLEYLDRLEPFDEIHRIYIRMTELSERILTHQRLHDFASDPLLGEMLGTISQLGSDASK